jgi:molecular chaperone Hsp33
MPGAEAGAVDRLEENVATAPTPSEIVRAGLDAAGMVTGLMAGFRTGVLEERPVRFQCRCSRERVECAILALGRDEMMDVLTGERRVQVTCEFCASRYVVEEPELRALLDASRT